MNFKGIPRITNKFRKGQENLRTRKLWGQERPVLEVAQDGSGDYQKIETALAAISSTGGMIIVKNGTYSPGSLTLNNNTIIEGQGYGTIIKITSGVSCVSKTNVILRNMKFSIENTGASNGPFDVDGSTKAWIEDCWISKNCAGNLAAMFRTSSSNAATEFKLRKCKISSDGGAGTFTEILWLTLTDGIIQDNDFGNINLFYTGGAGVSQVRTKILHNKCGYISCSGMDQCRIHGNYCGPGNTIELTAGSDYNSVTGNVADLAVGDDGIGNSLSGNAVY